MEQDLLVELECPICLDYMTPPIRQCVTGHNICDVCRKKLPHCALCRGKYTEARNLSLEALAFKVRYPCINHTSGCNAMLAFGDRQKHALNCPFTGVRCAMEKCPWIGKPEDLPAHWASKKTCSKAYNQFNICHTKLKRESYYVNLINAFNNSFWFKYKFTNNQLYFAVQFIGRAADAENYYYEVEIFKPGKSKKKVLLSDYCQTFEIGNRQLFNSYRCVCIDTDSIACFVSDEQLFIYYLRVHMTDEPKGAQAVPQTKQQIPVVDQKTPQFVKHFEHRTHGRSQMSQQQDKSRGNSRHRTNQKSNKKDGSFVFVNL